MVEVEEKAVRSDDRIFYDAFKANPNEKTGRRSSHVIGGAFS
jgi:hypothetical protein